MISWAVAGRPLKRDQLQVTFSRQSPLSLTLTDLLTHTNTRLTTNFATNTFLIIIMRDISPLNSSCEKKQY